MNIWDLAKEKLVENKEKAAQLEQKLDDEAAADSFLSDVKRRHTSHIVICGNKKSGKSSLQMNFVERKEELKEAVGLEFSYARRTRGNVKDVANLWELGGGHELSSLLALPFKPENLDVSSIFLVLDLTKLEELWTVAENLLESARRTIIAAQKGQVELQKKLELKTLNRVEKYEEDQRLCSPLPIPLTIVGSKYDEFQNFEPEKRRHVCQFLRFLAHYHGANLMMYSSKMEQFGRIVKNMMSHFAFGTVCPQGYMIDHNRPIFVKCGMDSFEAIGAPPASETSFMRASNPFELWKDSFLALFPQKETKQELSNDPMTDPLFKEAHIDNLVDIKRKVGIPRIAQKRPEHVRIALPMSESSIE
ncbi:unnamed protein product [Caenorhabditis auriculariae]|uniref:Cytoplasmic dynein 2 light intermediate chain 1 n=1 Tax=Caenorhabditis auriculariae TaxID=2777116 RepID=A0A8S1H2E7_9PELO|nr:unnamed protein product [Caenorhabditis auriculariae]